jgi:hypothetical protein
MPERARCCQTEKALVKRKNILCFEGIRLSREMAGTSFDGPGDVLKEFFLRQKRPCTRPKTDCRCDDRCRPGPPVCTCEPLAQRAGGTGPSLSVSRQRSVDLLTPGRWVSDLPSDLAWKLALVLFPNLADRLFQVSRYRKLRLHIYWPLPPA